jgi:CheY-like chemotaxis protein
LAISRRLVETMGGEIGVDEALGGGSCFWFTVPSIVVEAAPPDHALRGMRVAVVSPNRILAQGLTQQIREAGGDVVGAQVAPGERVDALLIDGGTGSEPNPVVMPEGPVPAYLLVAPQARGKLETLGEQGFAGYLLKPVRQGALIARLLEAVRQETARHVPHDADEPVLPDEPIPDLEDAIATAIAPELPPFVAAAAAPAAAPVAAPAPAAKSQTGLTILLAEDNPINMMLIRELLKRRGHSVVEVTNGNDAMTAMGQQRFDLLLTDIHMPGMDGIDAACAIRRQEGATGTPRVPIVALTADALETGKRACQEAGMDGFLTKPVDPAELEEMFLMLFPAEDDLIVAA